LRKSQVVVAMLTSAAQMLGPHSNGDRGAWGAHIYSALRISDRGAPTTLPFNCLPIVASAFSGQPIAGTLGLLAVNMHLSARDYVNIPPIPDIPAIGNLTKPHEKVERLLEIFTERAQSIGQLTEAVGSFNEVLGFSNLKRNLLLPYLMDPLQICNKYLSTLSSMENGKHSELAEKLAPSIKAYFQNVAGQGGNRSTEKIYSVIKCDGKWNAKNMKGLDLAVASKLGDGEGALVTYIDGPKEWTVLSNIFDNIRSFISVMGDISMNITSQNSNELKKLLPQEDLLNSHIVTQRMKSASDVLLLCMFQVRNPHLTRVSEAFFNQTLQNSELGYATFPAHSMDLIVKLSTGIVERSFFNPIAYKKMISIYDHTLFYKSLLHTIIYDVKEKFKSNGASMDLTKIIAKARDLLPLIQTKLVQELELKTQSETFSEETRSQILQNMYLIDNTHLDSSDLTGIARGLLSLDRADENVHSSQNRGQHWRVMQLFALIRSQTSVIDTSLVGVKASKQELEKKFNTFYEDLYQDNISFMFPAVTQTVFLNLWKNVDFTSRSGMSYEFLRKMYDQNKSIFWLPILGLVIQDKPIPPIYWVIAKQINITSADAASNFDFLCRWVYPLSYNSDQKSKLLQFSDVLYDKGQFKDIRQNSSYLSQLISVHA
jgi:hypothetical protein